MNEINITEMVRNYAAANCMIRKKQVVEALGITPNQVHNAVENLERSGHLKRVGHGTYEYVDQPMKRPAPMNERLWRGMGMHPKFSVNELARLAGTTSSYVYKVMRKYRAEGIVEPVGNRMTPGGALEKLWRLTRKGKQYRSRPKVKGFEPDPLVMKTVMLNKLICSGMARLLPEERKRAVRLCEEIKAILGLAQEAEGEA